MPITFQCGCGKKIQAPDTAAGKSGKCPGCGNKITIPQPVAAAPVRAAAVRAVAVRAAAPVYDAEPISQPPEVPAAGAASASGPLRAVGVRSEEKEITFAFQGVYLMAVATALEAFFTSQGYRLEAGTKKEGTYGTGSDLMRLLLGGFAKRYKFDFTLELREPSVLLTVKKGMSGVMGGALGYARMKKEMTRIFDGLQRQFEG
jgi:hypothetical protein